MVKQWPFLKLKFSLFFLSKWKNTFVKKSLIYVIDFDPIRIYTCLALQNDRQNLNFVKDICVVSKTMAINSCKMGKCNSCQFFFQTDFTSAIHILWILNTRWSQIFLHSQLKTIHLKVNKFQNDFINSFWKFLT